MLTQFELKTLLNYDGISGEFTWKNDRGRLAKKGQKAGCISQNGYIVIKIKSKAYKAHRLAWLYVYGEFPTKDIDHINGDKSDNRINNLRDVSERYNCYNRTSRQDTKSKIKNVTWHKRQQKWNVTISHEGKVKHIGSFDDLELAELVAIEARLKYHGEYAKV